jgi:hypothetical protein
MLQHAPARNLKFDAHAKKANAISVSGINQIRLSAARNIFRARPPKCNCCARRTLCFRRLNAFRDALGPLLGRRCSHRRTDGLDKARAENSQLRRIQAHRENRQPRSYHALFVSV